MGPGQSSFEDCEGRKDDDLTPYASRRGNRTSQPASSSPLPRPSTSSYPSIPPRASSVPSSTPTASPSSLRAMARREWRNRNYAKSLSHWNDVISSVQSSGGGVPASDFRQRCWCLKALRRHDEALRDANTAVTKDDSAASYHCRGIVLHDIGGRWREAVSDYDEALNRGGTRAEVLPDRANAYAFLEEWKACIRDANEAMELSGVRMERILSVRAVRGLAYLFLERYNEALTDLTFSIENSTEKTLGMDLAKYLWRRAFCRLRISDREQRGEQGGERQSAVVAQEVMPDLRRCFQLAQGFPRLEVYLGKMPHLMETLVQFFPLFEGCDAIVALRKALLEKDPSLVLNAVVVAVKQEEEQQVEARRSSLPAAASAAVAAVTAPLPANAPDPKVVSFLAKFHMSHRLGVFREEEVKYEDLPGVIEDEEVLEVLFDKRMPRERFVKAVKSRFGLNSEE